MTVVPLGAAGALDLPATDVPAPAAPPGSTDFGAMLRDAFGDASRALARADGAERNFAAGRGGLQEMVLQRAQADVALSLASAAASRAAQSLTTILGMQI